MWSCHKCIKEGLLLTPVNVYTSLKKEEQKFIVLCFLTVKNIIFGICDAYFYFFALKNPDFYLLTFSLKTYFHLISFDVFLLPQFLPDLLHFPSCQSLCSSFLSFKTNKNKRNTCTLPSSRWKCKQKTNKIKKNMTPAKWDKKSRKISMSLFCVGLLLLDLRACPKNVIHIPRRLHWRKQIFLCQWYQLQIASWLGRGSLCLHPKELRRELQWRN